MTELFQKNTNLECSDKGKQTHTHTSHSLLDFTCLCLSAKLRGHFIHLKKQNLVLLSTPEDTFTSYIYRGKNKTLDQYIISISIKIPSH